MNKKFKILGSSVLALSLLAGCGSKTDDASSSPGATEAPTAAQENVSIKMQIFWDADSGRGKTVREILDMFEKENPNIKVDLVGSSQNNQKLLTQILSGQAPEVMQLGYRDVMGLAIEDAFKDLSGDFMDLKANYDDSVFELGVVDDKLYGVPWNGHAIAMVYNQDMFEAAGITEAPTTWEELYNAAKKLTIDTDGDGKIDQYGIGLVGKQHYDLVWMTNMFVAQAGGEYLKDGKVGLNSPETKQALEFYKKLIDECSPPDTATKDGGAVMADFRNQITAIEFQGPWGVTDIWQNGNSFKVNAAPMPVGPNGPAADIGVSNLVIPETIDPKKEDAAKKLIEYLAGKEAQEVLVRGEKDADGNYYPFRVAVRNDMADTQYLKDHPEFMPFIDGFKTGTVAPNVPGWAQIEQEILTAEYNNMVTGKKSIDEVLKTIEEKGNALLK